MPIFFRPGYSVCVLMLVSTQAVAAGDIKGVLRRVIGMDDIVRCESSGGEEVICKADVRRGVTLLKQRSKSACTAGRSWRTSPQGIHVSQGCRADFKLGPAPAAAAVRASRPKPATAVPKVFRCESVDYRWRLCEADVSQGVQLVRQLSDTSPCVMNQSWGTQAKGVWVASGCRAEFRTGPVPALVADTSRAQMVRCESVNGMRRRCRVDVGQGVRLARQLSDAPCRAGNSWGHDEDGIWVKRGCRGEFLIDVRTEGQPPTSIPATARLVQCESRDRRTERCPLPGPYSRVRLKDQLSQSPCEEGVDWVLNRGSVEVKAGCRAVFAVW